MGCTKDEVEDWGEGEMLLPVFSGVCGVGSGVDWA